MSKDIREFENADTALLGIQIKENAFGAEKMGYAMINWILKSIRIFILILILQSLKQKSTISRLPMF